MTKRIKLCQFDYDLISDTLSNSHDWNMEHLDQGVINFLTAEGINITKHDATLILSKWNMVPPEKKFSPDFKMPEFLSHFVVISN